MSEILVGFVVALWLFLFIVLSGKVLRERLHGSMGIPGDEVEVLLVHEPDCEESWIEILESLAQSEQPLQTDGPLERDQPRRYSRV